MTSKTYPAGIPDVFTALLRPAAVERDDLGRTIFTFQPATEPRVETLATSPVMTDAAAQELLDAVTEIATEPPRDR